MHGKNLPLIDILIPVYNSENFIEKTLESIITQSFYHYNIYVIDDCSNDRTLSVIQKYKSKINLVKLKKNMGQAFCRNFGMRISHSKYICFLDSDDYWHKDKLFKQLKFMEKYNLDFSYTNYATIDENNKKKTDISVKNYNSVDEFMNDTSIATSSIMLKRSVINNLKFKKKGFGFDDYIFKCEILKKTKNSKLLDESLLFYRVRRNSISSKPIRNLIWIWRINKDYFKVNFFRNFESLFGITKSSILKYRLKPFLKNLKNKIKL